MLTILIQIAHTHVSATLLTILLLIANACKVANNSTGAHTHMYCVCNYAHYIDMCRAFASSHPVPWGLPWMGLVDWQARLPKMKGACLAAHDDAMEARLL